MKKHSGQFRRLTALALALCMLAALTAEIFAADIVDSGYCGGEGDGTNLTWTLDSAGTLTISGKGKMNDFETFFKPSSYPTALCSAWPSNALIGPSLFSNPPGSRPCGVGG